MVATSSREPRRASAATTRATVIATRSRISHGDRVDEVVAEPEMARRFGAGSVKSFLRTLALANEVGEVALVIGLPPAIAWTLRGESVDPREGAPGPGDVGPRGVGIGSQYWLNALSGGPAQPRVAPHADTLEPRAIVTATKTATRKRGKIDSVKPRKC